MTYDRNKAAKILVAGMLFITAAGCAAFRRNEEEPRRVYSEETARTDAARTITAGAAVSEEAAKEAGGKSYVEIQFMRDSAELTDDARAAIRALVEQSRQTGRIQEVLVLSWADEEYPSANLKKLSKGQVELANRRSEAIRDYVKVLTTADVDRYNLAKQPNVFSKWFNTTDARLKKALTSAGLPTTASDNQYPSKASHSVIIVR